MIAAPGALTSAFLVGAIVSLGALSVLVAVVLRDRLYAVYGCALGAYVGYQALERSYLAGPLPVRAGAALAFVAYLGLGAAFAGAFLAVDRRSRRWRLLLALLGATAVAAGAAAFALPRPGVAGGAVAVATSVLLAYQLLLAIVATRRGNAVAPWYAIGAAGLALGLSLHVAGLYDVTLASRVTADAGGAAVAWHAIFVSLALADRLRTLSVHATSLEALAFRDALTGLANRRAFDARLGEQWRSYARLRTRLALVMIDVDHFKAYNDAYGHQQGDAVLRAVAGAIGGVARRADELVARYGGEEFVLILPGARRAPAAAIAEAARGAVRSLAIAHPHSPHGVVTVSCGVAVTVPRHARDPARLIAAADRALYRAKDEGRDRTVVAAPRRPPVTPTTPTGSKNR